jgi:Saxitoxin biosynthesis operon protein SxtJ
MQPDLTAKQLRSFGFLVGGIFAFIGLWPVVWRGAEARLWAGVLGTLLVISAFVSPTSLRVVYRGWMALGQALGWFNTRIILGVVFYLLVTPMGLLMRLAGKDPMRRRYAPEADTYRVVRQPRPSSHMMRQF